jgi:hypothetical protein
MQFGPTRLFRPEMLLSASLRRLVGRCKASSATRRCPTAPKAGDGRECSVIRTTTSSSAWAIRRYGWPRRCVVTGSCAAGFARSRRGYGRGSVERTANWWARPVRHGSGNRNRGAPKSEGE